MKKLFINLTILVLAFFCVVPVSAQGLGAAVGELDRAAGTETTGLKAKLSDVVGLTIKGALALVGTIFLLLTIYAGILWMTASGKEDQIETAQKIIKSTIIGLFITMAAYAITFFVTSRLSGAGTVAPSVIEPGGSKLRSCVNVLKGGCFAGKCVAPEKTAIDTDCWNADPAKNKVCCY